MGGWRGEGGVKGGMLWVEDRVVGRGGWRGVGRVGRGVGGVEGSR